MADVPPTPPKARPPCDRHGATYDGHCSTCMALDYDYSIGTHCALCKRRLVVCTSCAPHGRTPLSTRLKCWQCTHRNCPDRVACRYEKFGYYSDGQAAVHVLDDDK